MNTEATIAAQVVHDKLESQIRLAEDKLHTLKAQAENAKANAELKAIAELFPKKQSIQRKLQDLKKSSGEVWNHAEADLETLIADFQKSVKSIELKVKAL